MIFINFFSSCDYSYEKQIGENYFVRCIESRERMSICFGTSDFNEGIIGQTVYEVHWNDQYILAKRHPSNLGSKKKEVTEYYILKKVIFGEAKASPNMYGPFILKEYEKKKEELGLLELEMKSISFDDLK